jgi:hypothetical protein
MAWAASGVHNIGFASSVNSLNVTINGTTAGSFIGTGSGGYDGLGVSGMTVSDGTNGSYSQSFWQNTTPTSFGIHYFANNGGGNLTLTFTPSRNSSVTAAVREFTGGATSSPASGTPSNQGSASSIPNTGSMTPADNDVLFLAGMHFDSNGDTWTDNNAGEGFTLSDDDHNFGHVDFSFMYKIVSGAPASQSLTWGMPFSSDWAAGIAAFKPATISGPAPAGPSGGHTLFKLKGYRGYGAW